MTRTETTPVRSEDSALDPTAERSIPAPAGIATQSKATTDNDTQVKRAPIDPPDARRRSERETLQVLRLKVNPSIALASRPGSSGHGACASSRECHPNQRAGQRGLYRKEGRPAVAGLPVLQIRTASYGPLTLQTHNSSTSP